ncbi:MAG: hypothetical protein CMI01_04565 [Oceanospirillaceae bacterium]|uniref:TonB C-terminal domain-containing protein n=1 Tax=Marinobacterium litorale TaxID=404770 RepID=UPI00040226C5|nr:TonB C-terminal domain-containing protein [Marinobacterium litorale]MBS97929.1 hypothetical protein [Oceanospirillaceae bacterium]
MVRTWMSALSLALVFTYSSVSAVEPDIELARERQQEALARAEQAEQARQDALAIAQEHAEEAAKARGEAQAWGELIESLQQVAQGQPTKRQNDVLSRIQAAVIAAWDIPEDADSDMKATAELRLTRDGRVEDATIISSNGSKSFNHSILGAFRGMERLYWLDELSDREFETHFKVIRIFFSPVGLR